MRICHGSRARMLEPKYTPYCRMRISIIREFLQKGIHTVMMVPNTMTRYGVPPTSAPLTRHSTAPIKRYNISKDRKMETIIYFQRALMLIVRREQDDKVYD
jgi:hypothetical protein